MPGGADLPYCRHLDGEGNRLIRGAPFAQPARPPLATVAPYALGAICLPDFLSAAGYVEAGGSYIGLCAGAYYACSRVEFEPGSRWAPGIPAWVAGGWPS